MKNCFRGLLLFNRIPTRCMSTNLISVGKVDPIKVGQKYAPGQLFIHKEFGYRGAILAPWSAHLYDRNLNLKSKTEKDDSTKDKSDDSTIPGGENISAHEKTSSDESSRLTFTDETYYQTLIHEQDASRITSQMHPNIVTYLGRGPGPDLYVLPAHDYVHHDEILPYTPSDNEAFQHQHFLEFFEHDPEKVPPWAVTTKLHHWLSANRWTEMRDVQQETTEDVRITVIPFYLGERLNEKNHQTYWWRYIIRMKNLNPEKVQLRKRHWKIMNISGHTDLVSGRGVVGEEPILSTYQYSSYITLPVPGGHMWGTFTMQRKDGSFFEVRVPAFTLERRNDLER